MKKNDLIKIQSQKKKNLKKTQVNQTLDKPYKTPLNYTNFGMD